MGLMQKIQNLIKTARLLSVDDSTDIQQARVSYLGKEQRVASIKPYGIVSNPPVNSFGILFAQQGRESNQMGIFDDPRNRPLKDLATGEVGICNYMTGDYAVFRTGGVLEIRATTVNITADNINIIGDVAITGNFTVNGKNVSDTHTHPILSGSSAPGPTGGVS